ERRLPAFLRDVAEAGRFGMTLADAIVVSGGGRYGNLTPQIKKMAAQITWGVPATEALHLFATRVKTPMIERVVAIIVKSSDAGGDVADVLTMVSHDTKENQLTEDERRIAMSTYIAVIYISFMVFLVTIWILNVTFLPKMLEELNRKKAAQTSRVADLDRERNEAKQELDSIETNRKAAVFGALDSMKKRYFSRLLGERGVKVKAPKVSSVVESSLGKITTIPKIAQRNMNEIEIQPILKNFAYVRILYDTMANEYFYEAIEPKLTQEESELLDVLKEILVESLELLDDAEKAQKEN